MSTFKPEFFWTVIDLLNQYEKLVQRTIKITYNANHDRRGINLAQFNEMEVCSPDDRKDTTVTGIAKDMNDAFDVLCHMIVDPEHFKQEADGILKIDPDNLFAQIIINLAQTHSCDDTFHLKGECLLSIRETQVMVLTTIIKNQSLTPEKIKELLFAAIEPVKNDVCEVHSGVDALIDGRLEILAKQRDGGVKGAKTKRTLKKIKSDQEGEGWKVKALADALSELECKLAEADKKEREKGVKKGSLSSYIKSAADNHGVKFNALRSKYLRKIGRKK